MEELGLPRAHVSIATKPLLDETEEPASNDCVLAEAASSETCVESLDLGQCEGYPDRILRGFESWSMVVTNRPTNDAGVSCERAAAIKVAYKGREKSRISCDEGGLCTEIRSCQFGGRGRSSHGATRASDT